MKQLLTHDDYNEDDNLYRYSNYLYNAILVDKYDYVYVTIKNHPEFINDIYIGELNLLMLSMKYDAIQSLEILLQEGADPLYEYSHDLVSYHSAYDCAKILYPEYVEILNPYVIRKKIVADDKYFIV